MLGALVEKISGLQLGEYMEANIFKPLGMNDTAFEVPEDKLHRVAALFTPNKFTVQIPGQTKNFVPFEEQNYCRKKPAAHSGGGGLCSTVDDFLSSCPIMNDGKQLANFRACYFKILLENQLQWSWERPIDQVIWACWERSLFQFGTGDFYRCREKSEVLLVGGAANTFFWFDPKTELSGVFMTHHFPVMYMLIEQLYSEQLRPNSNSGACKCNMPDTHCNHCFHSPA